MCHDISLRLSLFLYLDQHQHILLVLQIDLSRKGSLNQLNPNWSHTEGNQRFQRLTIK
jgi:hypothetical protein